MDDDRFPRDETGLRACEWCGASMRQPPTGRRRRYCSRTHRELAYRERKTQRRIGEAVAAVQPRSDSSVDETRPDPVPSVVETRRVVGMSSAAMMALFSDE